MNHFRSIFAVPSISLSLIACSAMAVGCMASPESEPTPATDSVEGAIINESEAMSIPMQSNIRLEGSGDALSLAPGAGWKELAPGVWESGEEGDARRIVVGAEGHRWAIEQTEKELAGLYERDALQADGDPAALDVIKQKETQLKTLNDAAQAIVAPKVETPQALSCNIGFYTGPSSPLTGYFGAAAYTEVSCSGGCQVFTIQAQACTNYGCYSNFASNYVCSSLWGFGVAQSGTYGAYCSSTTSISPPGVSQSWSGPCG